MSGLFAHLEVTGVDLIYDLQVARQNVLQHLDRPALQGLGEEGVVGVGEGPEK